MPRVFWPVIFLTITPTTLIAAFLVLFTIMPTPAALASSKPNTLKVLAAEDSVEDDNLVLEGKIISADGRSLILKQYLHRHKSPLEPYAEDLVKIADKYKLDFRLIVAIARQESNLCKITPAGSHNCWGWGIYTKPDTGELQIVKFPDYMTGAEKVAKTLVKYKKDGLDTPEEIMKRYTPPSTGSWAEGVNTFLDELE